MAEVLLKVENLRKWFPIRRGVFSRVVGQVKAVDGVSLDIYRGETLGLVGESGCGKTTVGRSILRLVEPTSGTITFRGQPVSGLPPARLRLLRKKLQIIFQDPYSSLNPRLTIGSMLAEPLKIHGLARGAQIKEKVYNLLRLVGLEPDYAGRYPHEFSGGQRQRLGIARALAVEPDFLVADEPVSALDVSIQAQIVNLLQSLQQRLGLTYLFISHDLAVIKHLSHRVAVMYLGRIVELAPSAEIYRQPRHPYTEALLSAILELGGGPKAQRIILSGDVPNPADPPAGCVFHPRCRYAQEKCRREIPALQKMAPGCQAACFYPRPAL